MAEEAGYARARAAAANAPLLSPTRDLGHLIGLLIAGIGFLIGSRRLSDNSFLTHLATGREMIAHGFVHSDVFTWTAEGHHVVVQSWLASAALGLVDKIAGGTGIRLVIALTAAALAGLSWSLTQRSPSVSTRVLVMLPVLVIGAEMWTERPLLLALVLFGLTLLVTEGERSVAGLSIVGFIWVGVHGSWPLGLVLLAARAAGARLDNTSSEREVRAFGWLLAGVLVGGTVNPYGPRLLIFPVELLGRRETLSRVTEWGSPSFDATYTKAFLLLLVMMVVSATRRSNWRSLLPAMVLVLASLMSLRNIPIATLSLLPVLAMGLPPLGDISAADTSKAIRRLGGVLAISLVALPLVTLRGSSFDLSTYPTAAVSAMEDAGISPADEHAIHPDSVGNYIEFRYGPTRAAWIDDRYELHSDSLMSDYFTLVDADTEWRQVLDNTEAGTFIWFTGDPIVQLVRDVAGWKEFWSDDEWTVLCDPNAVKCGEFSDSR